MRILGVHFKNLNSLTGEWNIDFTHPDYSSDGIFAITGPTGAGKTTILDAVCLGLYGRTPRLDKVTKSSNEIMSRQTGECFSEVTFETQAGRYRCYWSQHRARKKPDGELQPARHEVADAESGTVLESRILQVAGFIEETTGMDFDRFTRSMLLAQGSFAVFLQAHPNERSPILEQITGTEIYSEISIKVHERRVKERDELDLLLAELKGIQVLSEDEEKDLQANLKERQIREAELSARLDGLRKSASWLETMAALKKELLELDAQIVVFEKRSLAFEPERIRLVKSRKALGLEGDYRGVAAMRAQQGIETREFDGIIAALPEKDKACEEALSAKKAAEAGLIEARTKQQSEAEVIKMVRYLDAGLGEQKRRVEEKDKAISDAQKHRVIYTGNIDTASQFLQNTQDRLKAVHEYQIANSVDAALLIHISAISKVFASLRDLEGRNIKTREALAEAAKEQESALAACKKMEAAHEKSRKEFEKGQDELKGLAEEIAVILSGREIGQWHQEKTVLMERNAVLKQIRDAIDRIDKTYAVLEGLKEVIETSRSDHDKLSDEIKSCTDRKVLLEGTVQSLETHVILLSRIRDLEEERNRLEDGKPCPLCGAVDHPYAKGNVPELNKAEKELNDAKAELLQVSENLGKLLAGQARTLTETMYAEKGMAEKSEALAADDKQCMDDMLKLGMQSAPQERAVSVCDEMTAVQKRIAEISGIIVIAEDKIRQEKVLQKGLEDLRALSEASGNALQDSGHKVEIAVREHERLEREAASLGEESGKACTAALKDVEPFGIREISSADLDSILKDLTGRKDNWLAKQEEGTGLEKMIQDLKAGIDKDKALLEKIEQDLKELRKDRDGMVVHYESLVTSRRELYGEKDTDQEEKCLAAAVDEAGKAFENAREIHTLMEKEITAKKAKAEDLRTKTLNRAIELAHTEQNLTVRIIKAGFRDETDYVSACLVEEERERLSEQEKALIREKTELDARRKDKSTVLADEQEKHLTDQTLETILEGIVTCDSGLKEIRIDIGGMIKSLSENEKLRGKQQEQIKTIDARRIEFARWDALHQLIGSADGKKFRNFAQGLTFEMMTMHANRQLRKMTDRYLLIRDSSQPLELNVIDNYQAGEIRSTKNLSGGESFIVSLALALGLSRMASRKVRVDSLFLDEGFGTLDEEALETALETLAGLRQEYGKLIGVISHVTVLKERIGTQIQVIPETGGRSILNGPGCRRIIQ